MVKHFLDIDAFDQHLLKGMLADARAMKVGDTPPVMAGKQLAMIFEKPSTRTRVSFEVGVNQLGGNAVLLDSSNSQLGRGEAVKDTARVLSRYVDMIMVRCFSHETLLEFAEYATVPVINGLTNYSHPCQIMADLLTIQEHKHAEDFAELNIAWVGDGGNNMVHSWIHAAQVFGFSLSIASPERYRPDAGVLTRAEAAGARLTITSDVEAVVKQADVVNADCWVSMGDGDAEERLAHLQPYQVNAALMEKAKEDAIFLHCLPAHRGEEVTDEVIEGPQSVVFDEAENRLHVQKAIMASVLL